MTTPEQFTLFCKECDKWLYMYGLHDWDIQYVHERLKYPILAMVDWEHTAHLAIIKLDLDGMSKPFTDEEIRKTAHHEVLELLLTDYAVVCSSENPNKEEKEQFEISARHAIINRLLHREYCHKIDFKQMYPSNFITKLNKD